MPHWQLEALERARDAAWDAAHNATDADPNDTAVPRAATDKDAPVETPHQSPTGATGLFNAGVNDQVVATTSLLSAHRMGAGFACADGSRGNEESMDDATPPPTARQGDASDLVDTSSEDSGEIMSTTIADGNRKWRKKPLAHKGTAVRVVRGEEPRQLQNDDHDSRTVRTEAAQGKTPDPFLQYWGGHFCFQKMIIDERLRKYRCSRYCAPHSSHPQEWTNYKKAAKLSKTAIPTAVVGRLDMYRTKVLLYRMMVLLARLTKVRRNTCDKARPLSQV
jgi:hypothetical protein